ncbi:PIN domain-containing protein [Streptacidiphilus neutrinimicus]|uniref:PIN domain-containing protein n=1 Tax=Streptacidiphilus neutrinimicus TaxID=105420 RepID=UPI0005A82130|nr:PIN domain-containing protein [Streptacidiphilus neutrinimicus]
MIVLDTNMLDAANFPNGSLLLMLRTLAGHKNHVLAVPEMVRIEHVAHHRRDVAEALRAARQSLDMLGIAFGRDLGSPLLDLTADEAAALRSDALETFEILPIPPGAAEAALTREANRQPPAERVWRDGTGKRVKARGARDAVIWLTLLETARSRDEPVWFLSEDKDFAVGTGWDPDLWAEAVAALGEKASNLKLVQGGFAGLLAQLADPSEMSVADLEPLLRSEAVRDAVTNKITGPLVLNRLARFLPHGPETAHAEVTRVAFDKRLDRPHAYRVGDQVWVTGRARWTGRKEYASVQGAGDWWTASDDVDEND